MFFYTKTDNVKKSSGQHVAHNYTHVTETEKAGTVQNLALLINLLSMGFFCFLNLPFTVCITRLWRSEPLCDGLCAIM